MHRALHIAFALAIVALPAASVATDAVSGEVVVYNTRPNTALYDAFTKATGIPVVSVEGRPNELIEKHEDGSGPALDVIMGGNVDALTLFEQKGLFQPLSSDVVMSRIPAYLRAPNGAWFSTFLRGRVIFYNPDLVSGSPPTRYADLADPRFRGKVCLGNGATPYTTNFLSQMILDVGLPATEQWVQGYVANGADAPAGHDPVQILNVGRGHCAVTIANHYYFINLKAADKPEEQEPLAKVKLVWPDQDGTGTIVHPGGAGLAKTAKNLDNAVKFLEFLVSDEGQRISAGRAFFPAVSDVAMPDALATLGVQVKLNTHGVAKTADKREESRALVERFNWPSSPPGARRP